MCISGHVGLDNGTVIGYVYMFYRPTSQWRRQDLVSGGHDDRGAEGASIEARASRLQRRRVGLWGGVSAPQPTRGSGEPQCPMPGDATATSSNVCCNNT